MTSGLSLAAYLMPLGHLVVWGHWDGRDRIRLGLKFNPKDRPLDPATIPFLRRWILQDSGDRTVEATVRAFFAATARGDLAAIKDLMTGPAMAKLVAHGKQYLAKIKLAGGSFKKVGQVTIEGDRARATVIVDVNKVLNDDQAAKMRAMLKLLRARAVGETDPD